MSAWDVGEWGSLVKYRVGDSDDSDRGIRIEESDRGVRWGSQDGRSDGEVGWTGQLEESDGGDERRSQTMSDAGVTSTSHIDKTHGGMRWRRGFQPAK